MEKIKIAQIGAGHDHACEVIKTLKFLPDVYDLIGYAVVDGDEENYNRSLDSYSGVKKMTVEEILDYPGLQAVCIETEDRRLTEFATLAAEKGLHVYMDKPGSQSHEDFEHLIDILEEKNLVFSTGYMYRYNPAVLKLKQDIKDGKLGEIYAIDAQMNGIHSVEKRHWLENYKGGTLYYLGCHLIDLVYDILGMPEKIIPLSQAIGTDGVTGEDFGMVVYKYKNGVSFVKSTSVELGGFERRQFVVCGTKGTVELKPFEWLGEPRENLVSPQRTGVREAYSDNWHEKGSFDYTEVYGRYDAMLRAFADYVNGVKENPFSHEYERQLHNLILKSCRVLL